MASLPPPLPLFLLLLLALQLGAAAAGAARDAGAAAGTSDGVVAGVQGVGTGAAAAGGASAVDVKRGPAMSLDDLPLSSAQGSSANALLGAPLLAQGSALVPLPQPHAARETVHSLAEEERKALSTPPLGNASCVPFGFCLPPLCLVAPSSLGSYSFCGDTLGSDTTQASPTACFQYCSSLGAALFQFNAYTFSCECFMKAQSLSFTTKDAYTIGYTQGLCPYCAAGQGYKPAWGGLCQDCGDCLLRPSSDGACYSSSVESIKLWTAGTYRWWYSVGGCPSATAFDEEGTWTIPTGGSSFSCAATHFTSSQGTTNSFQFSSLDNCNSMSAYYPDTTCAASNFASVVVKVPPLYTPTSRATC